MKQDLKNIAVLTFQKADNYGAVLQCFALQQTILKLGVNCDVIDYYCEYLRKPWNYHALLRKGPIRYVLGNVNALIRKKRKKGFDDFRKNIIFSPEVTKDSIASLADKYDKVIVGSDQVWNYDITDFDPTFFLDWVQDRKKRNSYAASIGFTKLPEDISIKYKELLQGFDSISVREQSASKLLNELLGFEPPVVLDPTMLLHGEDWEAVIKPIPIQEKYIFVYQLSPSKTLIKVLKNLQKATNYKVVAVPFVMGGVASKNIFDSGPAQWLSLIKNAEYVVTDSFHATVFSIIFSKKFYSCINEASTRLINLLSQLKLNDYIYDSNKHFQLITEIDYSISHEILETQRESSLNYLKKVVTGNS